MSAFMLILFFGHKFSKIKSGDSLEPHAVKVARVTRGQLPYK